MIRTPQRGRCTTDAQDKTINLNIDAELKHELKRAVLEARTTTRAYVTRLVEGAVSESRPRGAARPGTPSGGGTARLVFRIDAGLRTRLQQATEDADVTVTAYLTGLIEEAVSGATSARGCER